MDNREEVALAALARMVDQYLEKRPDGMIDNYAMSAGESALEALSAYGYMEDAGMRSPVGRNWGGTPCMVAFSK